MLWFLFVFLQLVSAQVFLQNKQQNSLIASPSYHTLDSVISCGTEKDIFHISYLGISPDPPQRGKKLNILVEGDLDEDVVEGSYLQVIVKLGLIKLLDERMDLCEQYKQIQESCPIGKGKFRLEKQVDIPIAIFPGRYYIHATAVNADEREIGCVVVRFKMN